MPVTDPKAADQETTDIAMRVKLSRKAKEKLTALAAESGRRIDDCASDLLEEAVTRPTIDELLDPVRADFAASGMSQEQIMSLGRRELEALRREKQETSK